MRDSIYIQVETKENDDILQFSHPWHYILLNYYLTTHFFQVLQILAQYLILVTPSITM